VLTTLVGRRWRRATHVKRCSVLSINHPGSSCRRLADIRARGDTLLRHHLRTIVVATFAIVTLIGAW